ncbi:NUDIX domain-containing protein [Auraticoccus monumenti]|uniref:ADP-ribose pyrophosphatase YjhB, NUDIX family n=1 Tax=Auraticoccus monumenti TaxID=675864 RepID=A0A1G7A2H3_9ACTN|nr:NUDIX domain-containing protein [Auraticoccus monumenti]SDE09158.1 ADP-ribose pyrophosphatase YjhB, NUDIX family [Auraticoccus monumenti]
MSSMEQDFFDVVAQRRLVRPSVRAIIFSSDLQRVLVQRPSDSPGTNYAFIGGEYEIGDTFEARLRAEIEEETNARLVSWEYLFVVENRFMAGDKQIHGLEHYLRATIDREDVEPREPHLVQEWLPVADVTSVVLRPVAVRDLIGAELATVRHLVIDGWSSDLT